MSKLFVRTMLALAVTQCCVQAWNQVGHRTVAEIAWRQLGESERRAATELLKQHPHYEQLLANEVPAGVSTNEWVFLSAAVWPDWVRPSKSGPHKPESITRYDLYPHAIGHPFLRRGDTNQALIDNFFIAKPNAEMVLSNSIATLHDKKASAHDRAVSLCWVLHLMGDLHQPLHAASLVTKEKPRGDGLGGSYFVIDPREKSGKRINMHTLWDQLPGVAPGYEPIAALADRLTEASELNPANMTEYRQNKSIAAWVQESYRAAVEFAYSEDHVRYAHEDNLKNKKKSEVEIPTLSREYVAGALKIADRRVALAGQRLADELKKVW